MTRREIAMETMLLHCDDSLNDTSALVPPIFQTATFVDSSAEGFLVRSTTARHAQFYTRYQNPNAAQVESILAALEGAEAALLTASGMGAISTAILSLVQQGQHVVAQTCLYGGTVSLLRDVLPRYGIGVSTVDQRDPSAIERAIRPETALLVLESPSNPAMRLTDLQEVANLARSRGITTLADNTFATPLNQRPIQLGIDLVVHSATKYLGGHGDLSAGVILGSSVAIEKIWQMHVLLGASPSPFNAWLTLRGLRTLALRITRHNASALAIATFLAQHRAVKVVNYPGLQSHPQHDLARRQMQGYSGVLSFEVQGGAEGARQVLDRLRLSRIGASVGATTTLAVHAGALFSHYVDPTEAETLGISSGLIRLSVGLEAAEDLINDLGQALG